MKQMVFVVGGEASCGGAEDGVVDGAQGKAEGDEGSRGAEVIVRVGDKDDYELEHFVGQVHGSHVQADGGSSSHGFPTVLVSTLAFIRSAILAAATFHALACKRAIVCTPPSDRSSGFLTHQCKPDRSILSCFSLLSFPSAP